jgi:hypothetical protein
MAAELKMSDIELLSDNEIIDLYVIVRKILQLMDHASRELLDYGDHRKLLFASNVVDRSMGELIDIRVVIEMHYKHLIESLNIE